MQVNKTTLTTFIGITFLFLSSNPSKAYAQNTSISLSPPVISIQVQKNSSAETHLKLTNNSEDEKSIEISLVEVQPSVSDASMLKMNTYSLISSSNRLLSESINVSVENDPIPPEIVLKPNEEKELKLSILPTQNLQERDYYFALLATASSNDNEKVQIKTSTSSVVLLSIGSQLPTNIDLIKFNTESFSQYGPKHFYVELKNNSTQFESINAEIRISNMFGQLVKVIKVPSQYILSKSQKVLRTQQSHNTGENQNSQLSWDEKFLFGPYKANLIVFSNEKEVTNNSIFFIAIPILPTFIILFAIFMASGIYLRVKRKSL